MATRPRPLSTFLALLAAAAGGALLLVRGTAGPGRPSESPPPSPRSLLLVTLDTTRADRLEPYGAEGAATPHLAQLAREGVLFEAAYAVAPITLPAHATILTGLYPPQHGVRNNGTHYAAAELTTLAERLAARGFQTAAFVSAAVLERRYGLDQGFELYDDDLSAGRERHPRAVPDRPAEHTVAAARGWLDASDPARPFFLWVHLYDPHAPYSPPAPWRDRFRERPYDGEIAYLDHHLGQLLGHPRLGAGEGVLVSVLGDHGESFGEHGEQTHAMLAYDATMRIPWLLRVPGGPQRLRFRPQVDQADVVPTLLELLGVGGDPALPGRSVAPYLDRRREERFPARLLYAETYLPFYAYGWAKLRTARLGQWKLIEAPRPELYDLYRDPRELSDQYLQQPGIAHDLNRELERLLSRLGDPEREATLALDDESYERLRSLGYVSAGPAPSRVAAERPDPKEVVHLHVGIERARQLLADGLAGEAERALRAVLARDPQNLAAHMELAAALEAQGEVERALASAARAIELDPNNLRLHLQLAGLEGRRGDPEKGLELLDAALGLDPRSLEAALQKVQLLRQLGRRREAEETLAGLRRRHPEHPRVEALVAQGEIAAGDLPAATGRLRTVLARDPFLALGWRLLGEAQERSGEEEAALATYREGLARQPDDAELHARLGVLLARGAGGAEVEAHLREALRLGREPRPDLLVALGGWLAEQGRPEEAQRAYARALEHDPGHPAARNNRAIALYRSGRGAEALAALEELARELPGYADVHNNLAGLAVERQDWGAAEVHARRALALAPTMPEALNNLGLALEERGQRRQALERYRQALASAPGYWPARFNLGVLLARGGPPEEAAAELLEVLRHAPGYAEAHFELAELHAGPLADAARARAHYNAFVRMAPTDPRAAEARRRLAELP